MTCTEQAKDIVTMLGVISAGGYFGFKALFGYFNVNVSISVTCERRSSKDDQDYVAATVAIEKGANTALSLLHGEVQFLFQGPDGKTKNTVLRKMEFARVQTESDSKVIWGSLAPERALFVSPGERMHFACVAEGPHHLPCVVQAVILGRKRRWSSNGFLGQWRATAVSLPLPDDREAKE